MKIKCDFCGTMVDEKQHSCPNCGGVLSGVHRFAGDQPQTIAQLKEWYISHNLPPEEVTRFFIGKNITAPRAFGIYRDNNRDYVVYKNKNSGERAIRYRGGDEAYAVNELYQRLKSEIADQKSKNHAVPNQNNIHVRNQNNAVVQRKRGLGCFLTLLLGIFLISFLVMVFLSAFWDDTPYNGYYNYENEEYYFQKSSWYYYDDITDDWQPLDSSLVPSELITSDTGSEYHTYSHEGKAFEDTKWYVEDSDDDYESDWDNDYDWDSDDSWDSGDTDWDTDW